MYKEKKITCIMCPLGCNIKVHEIQGTYKIKGAACINGEDYALQEVSSPKRVIMSVIPCKQSIISTVAVKTSKPVPKEEISQVMKELSTIHVHAPVHVGDIIIKNVAGLSVDIIATRNAEKINAQLSNPQ